MLPVPSLVPRSALAGFLCAIAALFAAPPAQAKLIGQGSGTGFASASGAAKHPRLLRTQVVSSSPAPLNVDVSWAVSCNGRGFRFDAKQGTFNAWAPFVRRLPRPVRHPTKCHVEVSALQTDFSLPAALMQVFLLAR
jgi:hypothetical protein